jgi:6,7-dimethyl-8-ribityllumazine synthase
MKRDYSNTRVAIVAGRFNEEITVALVRLCHEELVRSGVRSTNIRIDWVPGAYELPFAAKRLASSRKYDAVICAGCVIKGDTMHDTYISTWAAVGIGQVGLETGVPVIFGVLTPKNEKQARERTRPGPLNRGREIARAAIEMIDFARFKRP